jgi:SAM-dependent methyltransferase
MLLTLTTTDPPATDLGYLLHKHPAKVQTFPLAFGQAHVFYPTATAARCTAALLLEIDPVGLVRGRRGSAGEAFALEQYVNDRPYVASSFMSVALAQVYGSALGGRCAERPELPDRVLALEARLAVLPCRGGEGFLRRLFEPLGYAVAVQTHPLDTTFPQWGESPYGTVTLTGRCRLQDLLSHLYVLIPVLDNAKHYWVGQEELEKLLRHGAGWLASHPERNAITLRYLKHQRGLARAALARLAEEDHPDPEAEDEVHQEQEAALEAAVVVGGMPEPALDSGDVRDRRRPVERDDVGDASTRATATDVGPDERRPSLQDVRMHTVRAVLRAGGAKSVLDLGCGEGRLLRLLLDDRQFERVVGMDVSHRALEIAADRLRLERLPTAKRQRLDLLHGSLMYRDTRLHGFDAAAAVEVLEHLDRPRLAAFERVVFEFARPRVVVLTTPNAEYNVRFATLEAGRLRHRDHRFEWTRAEFAAWAKRVAERFGYRVRFLPVGPEDAEVGPPTQLGVFTQT